MPTILYLAILGILFELKSNSVLKYLILWWRRTLRTYLVGPMYLMAMHTRNNYLCITRDALHYVRRQGDGINYYAVGKCGKSASLNAVGSFSTPFFHFSSHFKYE